MQNPLTPFGWTDENLPVRKTENVPILIIRGSFADPKEVARIKVPRYRVHANCGWELKDCIDMFIPQDIRYEVLINTKEVVTHGIQAFIWLI